MMKFLLDTHSLLWTVFEPDKLSTEAQEIIVDHNNIICLSLISLWEISIKQNIGRLDIPKEFFEVVSEGGFEILSLTMDQIKKYRTLPLHHRDPFERMLIIQARQQKLIFITRDSEISQYDVEIVKA
ncbi:type II toxin-antitoxin system VapC family toxin [Pleurocapsa sp. CCALA 161]|uniref:type II toxin-antitoxin system VapC family toxin n=1 Tax=Pleurocapsa sp. CCALA 161 TaxID=2107688 RepID=UPI001E37095D|nr:type II toxin-antitoxin system VapC family toxin [Pleurocapsa sp. CCALA 161]